MTNRVIVVLVVILVNALASYSWDHFARRIIEGSSKKRRDAGGQVDNNYCRNHCGTFSHVDGRIHPINCSTSFRPAFKRVICDEVKRPNQGTPSKAVHVTKDVQWYKYTVNDEVKLALNFSWMPGQDSSIRSLMKYSLEIIPMNSEATVLTPFTECFSIHNQLFEAKHKNAEFYYECYGIAKSTVVNPGGRYFVAIQSLPGTAAEKFEISIPRCSDVRLADVTYCVEANAKLEGNVEEVYCSNRSVKYSYRVPVSYGDHASVALCETSVNDFLCKNRLQMFEHLPSAGTLYNISLDSSANLSIGYTIFVKGSDAFQRNYSKVEFSVCPPPTLPMPKVAIILPSIAFVALFLAATAILLSYCFFRNKFTFWKTKEKLPDALLVSVDGAGEIANKVPLLQQALTVYVVFSENDERHVKVVKAFCRFLTGSLGLKIYNHLWEQNVADQNSVRYMVERFQNADKVLVICSKGTRDVLSSEADCRNMYAGAVACALAQVFGKNPGKCLLAYFDYSSPDDVPKQFPEYKRRYILMKDMNALFFAFHEVEQVQQGRIFGIPEIENYNDPEKRSTYADELCDAIGNMNQIVDDEA